MLIQFLLSKISLIKTLLTIDQIYTDSFSKEFYYIYISITYIIFSINYDFFQVKSERLNLETITALQILFFIVDIIILIRKLVQVTNIL